MGKVSVNTETGFAINLRRARTRAGLSLRELSDRMNGIVTHQAIKRYEDGEMYPSSRALVAIGNALDVSLDSLMSSADRDELDAALARQRASTLIGAAVTLLTDNETIAALNPIEVDRYHDALRILNVLMREIAV